MLSQTVTIATLNSFVTISQFSCPQKEKPRITSCIAVVLNCFIKMFNCEDVCENNTDA